MSEILLIIAIVLLVAVIALQVALLVRKASVDLSPVVQALQGSERAYERTERIVREEIGKNREEASAAARQSREELAGTLKGVGDSLNKQLLALTQANDQKLGTMRETMEKRLTDFTSSQQRQFASVIEQLTRLTESNEKRLDAARATVEERLKSMQADNAKNLDEMRKTVDEKLQGTLEKRLGESFKLVSERLEQVYKGLGEMQTLAIGVGDLKRVLTNVKARGTWGEVQLGAMLEEILNPDQYDTNVATKGGNERVEFAVRLPGRGDDKDEIVWLPIDAKFPIEDYQRLVEAQEKGDAELAEVVAKQLDARIKGCANDICSKYLNPPKTTDFGILFLPTEGLFAEVLRRPGLAESIQRTRRVVVAGPTTLWSLLNSLQMGFRTLAIEKRSSEVWKLLAAVKTEFGKYGDVLGKVQKKLREASDTIDTSVAVRTRAIERRLREVEELPAQEAQTVLMLEQVEVEKNGDQSE